MNSPPAIVGNATVIRWSVIDERHRPTGSCEHVVEGVVQGPAAGVAICQYAGESAFYLFGCDAEWNPVTDTWHETLEDAIEMAETEYEGISDTWVVVSS